MDGDQADGVSQADLENSPQSTTHFIKRVNTERYNLYDVFLVNSSIEAVCERLLEAISFRTALIVSTPTVGGLYSRQVWNRLKSFNSKVEYLELPCNEATKSVEQVTAICKRASEIKLDRKGLIVAIGGGVCSDLVTVAASWIRRGISHVRVPTTLIGQVDAGIGIKGAVNFENHKSFIGSFYTPSEVIIAPLFLESVPVNHLRAGLAEIVKIAMVRDWQLFELVEKYAPVLLLNGFQRPAKVVEEILSRSISNMLIELEPNIYEDQTYKRLVDFGHTFSPSIESDSNFVIAHGEAVAIDIAISTMLSEKLGFLSKGLTARIISLLQNIGLPISYPSLKVELLQSSMKEAMRHRGGLLNLVIPTGQAKTKFLETTNGLTDSLFEEIVRDLNFSAERYFSLTNQREDFC